MNKKNSNVFKMPTFCYLEKASYCIERVAVTFVTIVTGVFKPKKVDLNFLACWYY